MTLYQTLQLQLQDPLPNYHFCPDPQYNLPFRLLLSYTYTFKVRMRYYFIWLLSESLNNCAGLGFAGYDKRGVAKWDRLTNINIMQIEFGTSMRTWVNNWNALTSLWLRR